MKRKRVGNEPGKYASFGDIQFPRDCPLANYDTKWNRHLTDVMNQGNMVASEIFDFLETVF